MTIRTSVYSLLLLLVVVVLTNHVAVAEDEDKDWTDGFAGIDFYFPDIDVCDNKVDPNGPAVLGKCDHSRFPVCQEGKESLCYNRKPSRDHFFDDNHQPKYYIQYDRIFCYPDAWGGCSSCTPGRYCKSESRCILEEQGYPCEEWL